MTSCDQIEKPVTFTSEGLALSGTLTLPGTASPAPTVLMLPGSGQTDRDDNAKSLKINLFPQLVPTLTAHGFATFRYDKRGVGSSEGDYWASGFNDGVTDAVSAVGWLVRQPEVDSSRVFVLGHSEGALISARLAAGAAEVAGAILLAGSAKTGEETMLWQGRKIAASLTGLNKLVIRALRLDVVKLQKKALARLKATTGDIARIQLQKINAKWFREFLAYDPTVDLANVKVPILAVTGASDIQTDPSDLDRMAELVPHALESHVVPGVTHLLRDDPEDSGLKGYKSQPRRPIDGRVIVHITDWLEGQTRDADRSTK